MNGKLQTNAKKDAKWSDGDSKMLNSKTTSGKVENLLGFYELLEKRIGKSLEKTLDTTTISYQNLNLSIDDTR